MTAFTGRLNTMPRPYPPEFRARAIALVRAGKPQKQTAHELDIHPVTLSKWVKQDKVDAARCPASAVPSLRTFARLVAASTNSRPNCGSCARP